MASVGGRDLYATDLANYVAPTANKADSVRDVAEYVELWARDAAVSAAAEEELADDAHLAHQVNNYRDQLLRLRYEEIKASAEVDTALSDEVLQAVYEEVQLPVIDPLGIARTILINFDEELLPDEEFRSDWSRLRIDTAARARVFVHARAYAELALLNEAEWREVSTLGALAPSLNVTNLRAGDNLRREGSYLRVLEVIPEGQPAPFAYVRNSLAQIALTQRRNAYIVRLRNGIYQEAKAADAVKIYLGND